MASARRQNMSNSSGIDGATYSLDDLKNLKDQAKNFQAEQALAVIRKNAGLFKLKGASKLKPQALLEAGLEQIKLVFFRLNPTATVIAADSELVQFRAPVLNALPHLPRSYGYKGGAARLALKALLNRSRAVPAPRDLDIVRIGGFRSSLDAKVAARFMPEDFKHGNGVEVVPSTTQYFKTRDFTINEALLLSGQFICTRQALTDYLERVIRLSAAAQQKSEAEQSKLFLKALRFQAEAWVEEGKRWRIAWAPCRSGFRRFDVALQLTRALETGPEVARAFVRRCRELGILKLKRGSLLLERAIQGLKTELGVTALPGERERQTKKASIRLLKRPGRMAA